MRQDVHNWTELVDAVRVMNTSSEEPRVIVFHDSGGRTYRFALSDKGLVRIESDRRGNELHPVEPTHRYPEAGERKG